MLREVHRTIDWGRPPAVGSTSASRFVSNCGFFRAVGVRPPPGRRRRPGSSRSPDRTSLSPREIVERERPVVRATRPIPPWPKERASVAAQYRRDLSVSSGASDAYLARTTASSKVEIETVPGYMAHLFSSSPLDSVGLLAPLAHEVIGRQDAMGDDDRHSVACEPVWNQQSLGADE